MQKIIILITIAFSIASSASEVKKDNIIHGKKVFAKFYRSFFSLRKELPEKLDVYVIFLDLNQDGELDALASSFGEMYQDGWNWYAFTRGDNGKWKSCTEPGKFTGENTIYARPDSSTFYRPKKLIKPSPAIFTRTLYAKNAEPDVSAFQITTDKAGSISLKEIPLSNKKEIDNYEPVKIKKIRG